MSNYAKLQDVLKEIFEMDKADLDFGIYRIMNQKRQQVMDFIDNRLPSDIKAILAEAQSKDSVGLQAELDKLGRSLDDAGVLRETSPKYLTLKQQVTEAIDVNALEQEVFSHLASFFKRYYKDGDFISLRRYKKDVYAIPHEGEEVKLHWANHDQYYIKTSEYLKNYAFKLSDGKKVHFQLKEASTEQNNNKIQGDVERRFAIHEELPIEVHEQEMYINFTYEPHKKSVKQDDLVKEAIEVIQNNIPGKFTAAFDKAPTEKNKNRTLLEKHLINFISRNSFDFFIHKDLYGFLCRELDFYIKNEVLFLDDIATENPAFFTAQLSKIKALKAVAHKIITFLSQVEDFQKKLWLKKKFVISTNYCITVDRIPEKYYQEITQNQLQLAEWKEYFDVTVQRAEDLENEPYLVLDTKHFSEEFKEHLLAEFSNLDEETDAILINSENFQGLNLISEKFRETIKTVYIDPPYNTGDDGFLYKDNFSHSSWMSFLADRNSLARELLHEKSSFFNQIDYKEIKNLVSLNNQLFEESNFVQLISVKTASPAGFKTVNPGPIDVTEYVLFYTKNKGKFPFKKGYVPVQYDSNYNLVIVNIDEEASKWKMVSIVDYFYSKNNIEGNSEAKEKWGADWKAIRDQLIGRFALENADIVVSKRDPHKPTEKVKELLKQSKAIDSVIEVIREESNPLYLYKGGSLSFYSNKVREIDGKVTPTELLTDFWNDISWAGIASEGGVQLKNGKKPERLLKRILEISSEERDWVLDYFSGSGTTCAVSLKLARRAIGIEVGSYFSSHTLRRIKNVLYGDESPVSKECKWEGGGFVKYQVLESYEDSLNNLTLAQKDTSLFSSSAEEEYLLKYMMDIESKDHLLGIQIFKNPFDYSLKVSENNELVSTKVDLVETFNYLIGLYVDRVQRVKDIKLVEGKTREGKKTLVIWRNLETITNEETERVFRKLYDSVRSSEFDQIYINGDHHFDNVRTGEEQFKVKLIEDTFFKKMFNISEL